MRAITGAARVPIHPPSPGDNKDHIAIVHNPLYRRFAIESSSSAPFGSLCTKRPGAGILAYENGIGPLLRGFIKRIDYDELDAVETAHQRPYNVGAGTAHTDHIYS